MTNAPTPPAQPSQGGGQAQGGPSAQSATAQGDVKQMRVDDLINLANQQNLDVSALNDLIAKVNVSPNVSPNVAGTGGAGNQPAAQQPPAPTNPTG